MVHNKAKLEESISSGADLSKVVTTCVRNMAELFDRIFSFNQDISGWDWDTSNVTRMNDMFSSPQSFN